VNAERLHAIALAIRRDLEVTAEVSLVEELASALQHAQSEPAPSDAVVGVAQVRDQLEERLAAAPSNGFSPAWRQSLEELGVADLLGEVLREQIEEIFKRNEITLAAAAEPIGVIAERLNSLSSSLDSLISGLGFFRIGAEELRPGEFEVGFLIPRDAVSNDFEQLGKEFVVLDRDILGPIVELATGTREPVNVRMISSSGFQAFLEAGPQVAQLFSQILENLLSSYERIRRIRGRYSGLKDEDEVPAEVLGGLQEYAAGLMQVDITTLAQSVIDQYGDRLRGEGRVNEVHVGITRSLTKMANRIDEGYSIEVRAYELPEAAEEDEEGALPAGATPETEEARRIIAERQPRLQAMNLTGSPILELPEGDPPAEDGDPAVEDAPAP
jgi:hypothetical protein